MKSGTMGRMQGASFGAAWLRLRLLLARAHPLLLASCVLALGAACALGWTLWTAERLDREAAALRIQAQAELRAQALKHAAQAAPATPALEPGPPAPADNLDVFYAALGPRRHAGEQVRTLFALAQKNGLSLSQGEYKSVYDRNARVTAYQVNLPVKGSYGAIWQFALGALRAIPFASLDDISFRRDSIADPAVEARLRLTLYLKEGAGGGP